MNSIGVDCVAKPSDLGAPTATCMVFVTPDAERTMVTYLGACAELGPSDVEEDNIAHSEIVYLEGYLIDAPKGSEILQKVATVAKREKKKISFTLSDFTNPRSPELIIE